MLVTFFLCMQITHDDMNTDTYLSETGGSLCTASKIISQIKFVLLSQTPTLCMASQVEGGEGHASDRQLFRR